MCEAAKRSRTDFFPSNSNMMSGELIHHQFFSMCLFEQCLMNPITCYTAYLGAIAIICTWSGISALLRFGSPLVQPGSGTPLPGVLLISPHSTFRQHFGMNTTWHLHSLSYGLGFPSCRSSIHFRVLGGSHLGVASMVSRICQPLLPFRHSQGVPF